MIDPTHPEATCERCDRPNISWAVDSDRFNMAVASLGYTSGAVLCPVCFVEGHEKASGMQCSWDLVPGTPFRWIPLAAAKGSQE